MVLKCMLQLLYILVLLLRYKSFADGQTPTAGQEVGCAQIQTRRLKENGFTTEARLLCGDGGNYYYYYYYNYYCYYYYY